MNENKIIAAILTMATSARELRDSFAEMAQRTGAKPSKITNEFLPN
jgi:hypothetical protein